MEPPVEKTIEKFFVRNKKFPEGNIN